ncbi:oxaloacetate decarboxylase [Streptosporangium sp. NPDC087985]|uniref:isocitrate lyase/PEP mutase family protein n=1 Tax=Streptosporangium sp. NPDC087985 TaxID=3366196 RepID=UPI00380EB14A
MTSREKKTTQLRRIFERPGTTLMPFGVLPIHAQMAQRAGFEAFEVSGGMTSWWVGGSADAGLMTMTEVVAHAAGVARSVDIPVYCDADAGYGSAVNTWRTTQEFIRAGVAGIHIEDQFEPKKAGGQAGIRIVSDEEAIGRLRAAVDAKDELDPDFVVVARTDAYAAEGGSLDEAIRRGNLYLREAGADVIFYEGLRSWDEVRRALKETDGPAYAIASRHAGPHPSVAELSEMGQAINIVPFILPGVQEVWDLLLKVKDSGELAAYDEYVDACFELRGTERYVGMGDAFISPDYDDVRGWEEKYLPRSLQRDYENTIHD